MYLICNHYKDCKSKYCTNKKPFEYSKVKEGYGFTCNSIIYGKLTPVIMVSCTPFQYKMYQVSQKT